jgi:uncharacterized membrane protein YbhN (UPF0104 family)
MIKNILTSRWIRLAFSAGLIYLAFRKVNVISVVREIKLVPWWFVILYLIYGFLSSLVGAYRWGMLLFGRPGIDRVWSLVKASYLAGLYGLFLPSAVVTDLVKWLPLKEQYPELTKARLFSSVVVDRVVGFGAYVVVALTALLIGKMSGFDFPIYLLWLFLGLMVGVVGLYAVTFTFDVEKIILKIRIWKFHRLVEIARIIKDEDKRRLVRCFLVSVLGEFIWIVPVWFISLILGAGMSLLSVFIFMPVIGLILILPISVAGFGAREGLCLFFFGQLGLASEKILAVSTLGGLLGIVGAIIGGIIALFF